MSDENAGEIVTITEAAQRLDVSVRTIQRRLDGGKLATVFIDGVRHVQLSPNNATSHTTEGNNRRHDRATANATSGTTPRDTNATVGDIEHEKQGDTRHDTTRQRATFDATEGDTTRQHDATQHDIGRAGDARVIEILERENAFLKLQIEAANRATSEAHAALRAALAAQPKRLESGPQVLAADEAARETMPQVLAEPNAAPETGEFEAQKVEANKVLDQSQHAANSGRKTFRKWLLEVLKG